MKCMDELVLFRDLLDQPELLSLSRLFCRATDPARGFSQEDRRSLAEGVAYLADLAGAFGFSGNVWQAALTLAMVRSLNPYSLRCERKDPPEGSLRALALLDMQVLRDLFHFDLTVLEKRIGGFPALLTLREFEAPEEGQSAVGGRISGQIMSLTEELAAAEHVPAFLRALDRYYARFGVGDFGLHKAFRVQGEGAVVPIRRISHLGLEDLVGYQKEKKKLSANTEAFVEGRPANNCILYGDAGTGKSSSVRALANRYFDRGLRLVEIYKHQCRLLPQVIDQLKDRNYRFILLMDDLSFEDFETDYKYLKAVIEGGLEKRPENLLIYATSNRRHLIRESFKDRDQDLDVHPGDTFQEQQSLAARFGLQIRFGAPSPAEYQEIVKVLAARGGVRLPEDTLLDQAREFELRHGGPSGRTARQFIDQLLGSESGKKGEADGGK